MLANDVFEDSVERAGILADIPRRIAGRDQVDWSIKTKAMLSCRGVPNEESRNYSRSRPQRQRGDSGCRCGGYSEEVHEDAFIPRGVLIHQDANRFVVAQGLQNVPGCVSLVDRLVSRQPAVFFDHAVGTGL